MEILNYLTRVNVGSVPQGQVVLVRYWLPFQVLLLSGLHDMEKKYSRHFASNKTVDDVLIPPSKSCQILLMS